MNKYIDAEAPDRKISVSLVGKEVPEESIIMLRQKMEQYGLENVRLDISQGFGKKEEEAGREGLNNLVLQDFYRRNQEKMKQQVQEINYLKSRLEKYTVYDSVALSISPELKILFPYIRSIAVSRLVRTEVELQRSDTLTVAFLSYQKAPVALEEERFKSWLATRLKVPNVEIIRY